jgi:hypothetical protein
MDALGQGIDATRADGDVCLRGQIVHSRIDFRNGLLDSSQTSLHVIHVGFKGAYACFHTWIMGTTAAAYNVWRSHNRIALLQCGFTALVHGMIKCHWDLSAQIPDHKALQASLKERLLFEIQHQ